MPGKEKADSALTCWCCLSLVARGQLWIPEGKWSPKWQRGICACCSQALHSFLLLFDSLQESHYELISSLRGASWWKTLLKLCFSVLNLFKADCWEVIIISVIKSGNNANNNNFFLLNTQTTNISWISVMDVMPWPEHCGSFKEAHCFVLVSTNGHWKPSGLLTNPSRAGKDWGGTAETQKSKGLSVTFPSTYCVLLQQGV